MPGGVVADHGGGFRQTVALTDQQAHIQKEIFDILGQGRASGREEIFIAAHDGADLAQHQPVGQPVLEGQNASGLSMGAPGIRPLPADGNRPAKQMPPVGRRLFKTVHDGGMDFFIKARHADHDGRLDLA